MKREFIIKSIIAPLVIGIVFGGISIGVINSSVKGFSASYDGANFASFETKRDEFEVVDKSLDEAESGDCIGNIVFKSKMPVVVNAPYSMLYSAVSYDADSVEFGKSGYVYLKTNNDTLEELEKSITFYAEGCFDKTSYVLADTRTFDSAQNLKAYTPDIGKAAIVYARMAGKIGVKDSYKALIFEEVQL